MTTLRAGDLVEVLSESEILATLDDRGELESLPFMPEMSRFCGRRMTVHKVANKLCDTIGHGSMRRMVRAVHLTGGRCDGQSHGGCQTACSLYFKEAWVRKVQPDDPVPEPAPDRRLLPLLQVNTRKEPGPEGEERFSCQATELLRAAPTCLPAKDLTQYARDVGAGNTTWWESVRGLLLVTFNRYQRLSRRVLPPWLRFRGGLDWGWVPGGAPGRTPTGTLDLQPGELVRIKPKEEILRTLNQDRLNRGLGFEEEMARHCGTTARVTARIERCVDERTGEMLQMKSPCIALEGVVCGGVYSVNCPREFIPFWREIWLERVTEQ
jgi:hypothetical protein